MNPRALTPVLRVLRGCLHLLFAALLVLATIRSFAAVSDARADAWLVALAAALTGAVYAAGPALPRVRTSTVGAACWLAGVMASWLLLLALTQDGVWLAFPLFFVQLHLLPLRWSLSAVAATTAAAIAGFGWHTHTLGVGTVIGPLLGAGVAVAVVLGYQALYRESEQRQRLIEELTAARSELAAAERSAGVLAERERLAREIHDTLAQGLSSIQLLLRAAERALPEQPLVASGHVEHARLTTMDNLAEARRFVRELSPPDLEGGSLPVALERLCAATGRSGTDTGGEAPVVHFQQSGQPLPLSGAVEVALLRIAQSALGNTVRHSRAARVELTLSYMATPGTPEVALDVVDDGIGFAPGELPPPGSGPGGTGFGLAAMRARARALQGTFVVESAPGQGTAVAVTFPALSETPPALSETPDTEGPALPEGQAPSGASGQEGDSA